MLRALSFITVSASHDFFFSTFSVLLQFCTEQHRFWLSNSNNNNAGSICLPFGWYFILCYFMYGDGVDKITSLVLTTNFLVFFSLFCSDSVEVKQQNKFQQIPRWEWGTFEHFADFVRQRREQFAFACQNQLAGLSEFHGQIRRSSPRQVSSASLRMFLCFDFGLFPGFSRSMTRSTNLRRLSKWKCFTTILRGIRSSRRSWRKRKRLRSRTSLTHFWKHLWWGKNWWMNDSLTEMSSFLCLLWGTRWNS